MNIENRVTYTLFHHPIPCQPSAVIIISLNIEYRITYTLFHCPECCQPSVLIKPMSIEHMGWLTPYSIIQHFISHLVPREPLNVAGRITYILFHCTIVSYLLLQNLRI